MKYLGWLNHSRLHESLGDLPPAEFEAEALRAQAGPEASEGPAIDGRPLRSPVPSEILISSKMEPTKNPVSAEASPAHSGRFSVLPSGGRLRPGRCFLAGRRRVLAGGGGDVELASRLR